MYKNSSQIASPEVYRGSPGLFPAWVPATIVATGMMLFLAISFYIRHKKVVKKRELLMDYFHIISQYGGMQRKRMVTALCNSNSIRLKDLGKSFVTSIDSIGMRANRYPLVKGRSTSAPIYSCPFYEAETSLDNGALPSSFTPRTRSRILSRRLDGGGKAWSPFLKFAMASTRKLSQSRSTSLQDIFYKFKAMPRPTIGLPSNVDVGSYAAAGTGASSHPMSSMCTMLDDNNDCQNSQASDAGLRSPQWNPYTSDQRLSPYYMQHSRFCGQLVPNSSPSRYQLGEHSKYDGGAGSTAKSADNLSGVMTNHHRESMNEPSIFVQSASIDSDPDFVNLPPDGSSGLMVLRRSSCGSYCSGQDMYYVDRKHHHHHHQQQQQLSPTRHSEKHVNHVSCQQSDTSDYFHCVSSPNPVMKTSTADLHDDIDSGRLSAEMIGKMSDRKRRVSIKDLHVSKFNQRIMDRSNESLPESSALAATAEAVGGSSSITQKVWTKFKNVFSGSRQSSQSSAHHQRRLSKSFKRKYEGRSYHRGGANKRWDQFTGVFSGVWSLGDHHGKTANRIGMQDKLMPTRSLPMGLDSRISGDLYRVVELDSGDLHFIPHSPQPRHSDPMRRFSSEKSRSHLSPPSVLPRPESFPDAQLFGYERQAMLGLPRCRYSDNQIDDAQSMNSFTSMTRSKRHGSCTSYTSSISTKSDCLELKCAASSPAVCTRKLNHPKPLIGTLASKEDPPPDYDFVCSLNSTPTKKLEYPPSRCNNSRKPIHQSMSAPFKQHHDRLHADGEGGLEEPIMPRAYSFSGATPASVYPSGLQPLFTPLTMASSSQVDGISTTSVGILANVVEETSCRHQLMYNENGRISEESSSPPLNITEEEPSNNSETHLDYEAVYSIGSGPRLNW